MTLTKSVISDNTTSGGGGGIENEGSITLTDSTISGNRADVSGGGIENEGNMTLMDSKISGDTTIGGGGAASNDTGGSMRLTDSTISGNTARDIGGIYNAYNASMMLTDSTISGNTAGQVGGIYNSGSMMLTNSTISGNTASEDYIDGILNGGSDATASVTIDVILIFCTIVNNNAPDSHGYDLVNTSRFTYAQIYIKASIVGRGNARHAPVFGVITSEGYNVIQGLLGKNFVSKMAPDGLSVRS
jgi:hypothetical protein